LKIVVIGLLCATLVAAVGIFAQVRDVDLGTAPLVKAGQPTAMTGRLPSADFIVTAATLLAARAAKGAKGAKSALN
jgi:hypothetical protein